MERRLKTFVVMVAVAIVFAQPIALFAAEALEDIRGVQQFHWQTGVLTLPNSGGIVSTPPAAKLLTGPEVRTVQKLEGTGDPTAEAELRFVRAGTVEYQFCNCGYIVADDWSCVDANDVAASIRRYFADSGDEVLGFARPPRYDRAHASITYLIHFRNEARGDFYEANALIFGRDGFETLVADTRKGDAASTWAELRTAMASFRFPAGRTYGEFKSGDTTSANHIAAAFANKAGADDLVDRYFYNCRVQQS